MHRKKKKRINKIIILTLFSLIALAVLIWAVLPPVNDTSTSAPQITAAGPPANLKDNGSLPPVEPLSGDSSGLVEDKQIIYKVVRKDDKDIVSTLEDHPDNIMETKLQQIEEPGILIVTAKGVFTRPSGDPLPNPTDTDVLFQKVKINEAPYEMRSAPPKSAGDYMNTTIIAAEHLQGGGAYNISWTARKGNTAPAMRAIALQSVMLIEFIPDSLGDYYPDSTAGATLNPQKISVFKRLSNYEGGTPLENNMLSVNFTVPAQGYSIITAAGEFRNNYDLLYTISTTLPDKYNPNKCLTYLTNIQTNYFNQSVYNINPETALDYSKIEWNTNKSSYVYLNKSIIVVKFYPKNLMNNAP